MVDELVGLGFLKRATDDADRRVQPLTLTTRGRDVRRQIVALACRCDEILWKRLSAPDLEKVVGGLQTLTRVIEEE